jgi:signal transduction histidine kinase
VPDHSTATPLQQVSLSRLMRVAALIALTVTGPVIFLPAVAALLLSDTGDPWHWIVIGIPLAVWLVGLTPALASQRARVQTSAGLLLIVAALAVPSLPWIPVTISGFAVIVGAVFTLSTRSVIIVIALASAVSITYTVTRDSPFAYAGSTWWAVIGAALINVAAGGGLLIAWRSWQHQVAQAEREYDEVNRATEERRRDEARSSATAAATRRIHETALNTLTALSMGVSDDRDDAARAACRHDLEQAAMGLDLMPDSRVSMILTEASRVVERVTVTSTVSAADDVLVPASIANPLRDAVVEALRNVARHSGVDEARISVVTDAVITIEVVDDGVGLAEGAIERFGLRNTIRSTLAAIGGSATAQRRPGGGTSVILTAPRESTRPRQHLGLRTLRIVDSSPWARIGLMGTSVYMLALLAPVATSLGSPLVSALVSALVIGYVAALAALAVGWQRIPRGLLTVVCLTLLIATFLVTASGGLTCTNSWATLVLLTGMTGGAALLPLLALTGWLTRGAAVLAVAASSVTVILATPAECRELLWLQWGVTTAYLAAFALGLTWVEEVFERQRDAAQARWLEVLEAEAAAEARRAATSTWGELSPQARDLLEGIADGSVDLRSPDVSARAAAEADALRTALGLSPAPGQAVAALARRLVRSAARLGCTVELELLSDFHRTDPYPDEIAALLESFLGPESGGHLVIRGFVDEGYEELVAVSPRHDAIREDTQTWADTQAQVILGSTEVHVIVRRPIARGALL